MYFYSNPKNQKYSLFRRHKFFNMMWGKMVFLELKIQEEIKEKEQLRFVLATQGQKQQALLQQGRRGLSNKDRKTQRRTNKLTVNLATNVDYSNSNEPQRKIEDSILGTSRKSYKMLYDYDSSTHNHHTSASVFAEIPKKYFLKE
jgi:hypothetical protein